jgi:uncharacterized protein (TIGR02646 family)
MIRYRRPRVILSCLCAERAPDTTTEDHVRLLQSNPDADLKFDHCWSHAQVHGALHAMQGWVCAYCLRKTDPRDAHHVDHFRPTRGGYFWLAYDYGNYFWSCSLCNPRKGERFPLGEGCAKLTYETRAQEPNEGRLLIDPVHDPVDNWLTVEVEDESKKGEIKPIDKDLTDLARKRADATSAFFEWNTDADYIDPRIRLLEKLSKLSRKGKEEQLARKASRFSEHSLTVRSFLAAIGKSHLIPDPKTELQWFVEKLCLRLKSLRRKRRATGGESPSVARRRKIVQWTLAVLWKAPPPEITSADVEAWLDASGCKKLVLKYHRNLCNAEMTTVKTQFPTPM